MVCHHPLLATKYNDFNGNVKINVIGAYEHFVSVSDPSIVYDKKGRVLKDYLILPCGQCIGCRLERSRQWAVRCIAEAQLHDYNCFLTLTYDDAHLPHDGSLHKDHLQKFLKRLRKALYPLKIRFFACGEYGSKLNRPHYHLIIFGWRPDDQKIISLNHGSPLFISDLISRLWPFGFHTVGDVTFDSAAYVARYILKKHNGKDADMYYDGLVPEYVVMSRRPGIAHDWLLKYADDVYPHDFIVIRDNIKCRPPRYYDKIYDDISGNLEYVKNKRLDNVRGVKLVDLRREENFIKTKIKKKEVFTRNYEDGNIL